MRNILEHNNRHSQSHVTNVNCLDSRLKENRINWNKRLLGQLGKYKCGLYINDITDILFIF